MEKQENELLELQNAETMTVSQLILYLQKIEKGHGNVPIFYFDETSEADKTLRIGGVKLTRRRIAIKNRNGKPIIYPRNTKHSGKHYRFRSHKVVQLIYTAYRNDKEIILLNSLPALKGRVSLEAK